MEWVVKRSGLLVEDSADDACIRLRGLPFGCAKDEIAKFFDGKQYSDPYFLCVMLTNCCISKNIITFFLMLKKIKFKDYVF